MKLSLDYLKTFYYCCKFEGLGKAATYLKLSNSGVSSQIATLEKELAVKLMVRNKAGITLTSDGQKLLKFAKDIIPKADIIPDFFKKTDPIQGDISLVTWAGIGSCGVSRYIADFIKENPKIRLIVKCIGSDADIENYIADVMIAPYIANRPDLKQIQLFSAQFYLYASKEYLEKNGEPKNVGDLENHKLVSTYDNIENLYTDTDWHLKLEAAETRKPTYVINSSMGIIEAVKSGIGIGSIPSYINPEEHGLIKVMKHVIPPKIDFYYIYPIYLVNIKRIKMLGEYLKLTFPIT